MIKMPLDFNVIKSMVRIIWWESILGKWDEKNGGTHHRWPKYEDDVDDPDDRCCSMNSRSKTSRAVIF